MASVIWNQLVGPFNADNWRAYDSTYISVSFSAGVATLTYSQEARDTNSSLRAKNDSELNATLGDKIYLSYEINPESTAAGNYTTMISGIDYPTHTVCAAGTWTRVHHLVTSTRTGLNMAYFLFSRNAASGSQGRVCRGRNPVYINLTTMYGAGNEPTIEEFERQCALNGIDFTKYQQKDLGTPRHWITSENKKLQTARSGNTIDSEDIAHFVTNCAMPLRSCQIEIKPSLAGYDSIELDYRGRNLLINIATPGNSVFTLNSDGSVSANGTVTGESWFIWNSSVTGTRSSSTQYVQTRLLPNGRYFLAKDYYVDANHQSNTYPRYSLDLSNYDGTNERKGTHCTVDSEGCMVVDDTYKYNWMRIYESKANTYSNYTFYPQTYLASEPNRTWEPCNWRKFTVNFDNKIYGGTLDLVTGKLVVDVGCVDLGTLKWVADSETTLRFVSGGLYDQMAASSGVRMAWALCSDLTPISDGRAFSAVPDQSIYQSANGNYLYVHLSNAQNVSEVPTLLSGVKYVYKLRNPVTYMLTPQEIITLLGVNNVWCNDGKVTLQYYANSPTQDSTDMLERRRLAFVANSPHLQYVESGNTGYCDTIARFKTNLTLPLKEATVTLSPIQEGSGDPSPTNIRAISGVDSIQVTKAGVNLLECDTFSDGTTQGITYTKTVNDSNQIESIQMAGKTISGNVFRNLNYTQNAFKLFEGMFDFYSYSTQVAVIPVHTNTHYNDISGKWASNFTTVDWDRYNITKQASAWARLQTISASSNVEVNTTVYPMMCLPQDRGCDYEPFNGIKYDISLPTTIYEGTLNLITGELTVNYKLYTFTGEETGLTYNWDGMLLQVPDSISDNGLYIIKACSHTNNLVRGVDMFNTHRGTHPDTTELPVCAAGSAGSQLRFRKRDLDPDYTRDIELYRTWLRQQYAAGTPLQMVYQLQTPLVYQLTPPVIRTFRGVNNIWSDNGIMNIKYWTN